VYNGVVVVALLRPGLACAARASKAVKKDPPAAKIFAGPVRLAWTHVSPLDQATTPHHTALGHVCVCVCGGGGWGRRERERGRRLAPGKCAGVGRSRTTGRDNRGGARGEQTAAAAHVLTREAYSRGSQRLAFAASG